MKIILYLEKNYTLFGNLSVATLNGLINQNGSPFSVAKTYFIKYYTLFWQSLGIILYTFFQSNALKIVYYRTELSKRIKTTLFILFSLKYLIHVRSYQPISISKKKSFGARTSNTHIFQAMSL